MKHTSVEVEKQLFRTPPPPAPPNKHTPHYHNQAAHDNIKLHDTASSTPSTLLGHERFPNLSVESSHPALLRLLCRERLAVPSPHPLGRCNLDVLLVVIKQYNLW